MPRPLLRAEKLPRSPRRTRRLRRRLKCPLSFDNPTLNIQPYNYNCILMNSYITLPQYPILFLLSYATNGSEKLGSGSLSLTTPRYEDRPFLFLLGSVSNVRLDGGDHCSGLSWYYAPSFRRILRSLA